LPGEEVVAVGDRPDAEKALSPGDSIKVLAARDRFQAGGGAGHSNALAIEDAPFHVDASRKGEVELVHPGLHLDRGFESLPIRTGRGCRVLGDLKSFQPVAAVAVGAPLHLLEAASQRCLR
jgi:hypothetical protein